MKTKWLFPHRFQLIGGFVFIPSAILGIASMYFEFSISSFEPPVKLSNVPLIGLFQGNQDITDEIAAIGIIIGLLFIAFSREKVEDEMISQLRLEALQWSVYANYIILAIAILTVYGTAFFNIMIYNMFTILLVFIARFRWLIFGTTILRYEKPAED